MENPNIKSISPLDLWFSDKILKSTKIALMMMIPPISRLMTHQYTSQSSGIILVLEYITQNSKENPIINFVSRSDLWFSGKMLKSTKIALMVAALWLLITTKLPTSNLRTHQTPFQSSRIILILEYMTQNFKENLNINFVSRLELWFSGKMLKSTKIALVMIL
jgi:hypothetical protein